MNIESHAKFSTFLGRSKCTVTLTAVMNLASGKTYTTEETQTIRPCASASACELLREEKLDEFKHQLAYQSEKAAKQ